MLNQAIAGSHAAAHATQGKRTALWAVMLVILLAVTSAVASSPARAASDPVDLIVIDGEPGFNWHWGQSLAQVPPDGPRLVTEWSDTNRLIFNYIDYWGHDDSLSLRAPAGEDLAVGTYTGAEPGAYPENGQPRLDATCGHHYDGRFTVHELAWGAGGELDRAAISIDYSCNDVAGQPPRRDYHAEIRYSSTIDAAAITIEPHRIEYPERFTDTSSNAKPVTITNPGTVPMTLHSLSLGGPNPGQFALVEDECSGQTIAPGGRCIFKVRFQPTSGGAKEAHVIIDDTATHFGRHWLKLFGTGVVPKAEAWMGWADMDFAWRHIGTASGEQIRGIRSMGNIPLEIESVAIVGAGEASFVLTEDLCSGQTLPVDGECRVKVRFKPVDPGWQVAELRVRSNDPDSPERVTVRGLALREQSAVKVGYERSLGPRFRWNTGSALVDSTSSMGSYLHATWVTPVVKGKPIRNDGPYLGVQVVRRKVGTASWPPGSVRINPLKQHGDRPALAASGRSLYATWVSIKKPLDYKGWRSRTVYFRAATSHGKPGTWGPVKQLSPLKGKVDYPTVAAAGTRVYVAWTNATNGEVKLAQSTDRGKTWTRKTLGTAYSSAGEGKAGFPVMAADDNLVAIAWLRRGGEVVARISTNGGSSWSTTKVLTGPNAAQRASRLGIDNGKARRVQPIRWTFRAAADTDLASSVPGIDVLDGRVAVTWATGDSLKVRIWEASSWGPLRGAYGQAEVDDDVDYIYGPAVVLNGADRVGLAYSMTRSNGKSSYVMWTESDDNGQTWFHRKFVGQIRYDDKIWNEWPSVAWPWKTKRVIAWNAIGEQSFRLRVREANGNP